MARVKASDARKVYKLFWIVEENTDRAALIDSRSGKRIPTPEGLKSEPPVSEPD